MRISVLIADDDALLRQGVRVVLDSATDIDVVGEAGDGIEAVNRCRELKPDVVLMDVRMPGVDGIEATRRITAEHDEVRVLVLTTFRHDDYVWGALRAGASGFLLKRTQPESLIEAVRTIHSGDSLLDAAVTRELIDHFVLGGARGPEGNAEERAAIELLTDREREVLSLVAKGRSNAELAAALFIAESTAKTHVKRILAKIGARDRAQAVVVAYRSGLVAVR
ncbi:response regulator transcription factor [Salinibacterium sp. TMP30]|uniref:response regulator transcription factor n=1 Tax=Salinibacterium sp. TMP30 TaxID=3138237 RepID=UPI00313A44A7